MRIILDANGPRGVRGLLPGHDVRTPYDLGWSRYSNGQLFDELEKAGFEAFITGDQNLAFQQNFAGRNIALIIPSTNIWPVIRAQPELVRRAVASASLGTITRAVFPRF